MKNHISSLFRLAIVSLAAFPAFALAAPTAGTPYYTDVTNSYVQDQTSEVMGRLNSILCYMGAMAPDQMVNTGDANGNYIALVNSSVCDNKGSGGQSGNTGAAYEAMVVNSTRVAGAPMKVKVWADQQGQSMPVYAEATEAPSTTNPYGVFSMNYCAGPSCAMQKGFINAATTGLTFYSGMYQDATHNEETKLKLNAIGSGSSATGSGAASQTYAFGTCGGCSGSYNFTFAYNANAFVRNDGTTGDLCFDRNPANADESVWRYGLYDATTGAQITRKSGFPVEYTTGGVTYNGYVGYYGLWMPVTVPSPSTVYKVTYGSGSPVKTPYTLNSTGGKLMKYTTANKTLADLNKITFWYFAQANIGTGIAGAGQYELYWDDATKQFMVSGKQNTSNGNMESYATPVTIDSTPSASNIAMQAANQWGLWGYSQMMGGMFGIKGTDFANLTSATPSVVSAIPVKTQAQDVVYPSQFPASLVCINDCPTAALITTSNNAPSISPVTPFVNAGWSPVLPAAFYTYTFDATTGNLLDAASTPAAVVSAFTTGNNANGIRSGRLVTATDRDAIITLKEASGLCGTPNSGACSTTAGLNQGDVDLLPVPSTYYVWETGGQPWNQIAYLMSQATPPVLEGFDAPLQVSYTVPANTDLVNLKPYGNFADSTMTLQYGGFGDLWGIPNECIDITTNTACVFSATGGTVTPQANQRWASKFTIPFDAAGVKNLVTVSSTQGTVTAGTTYLVKALDKEVRLAKLASCPAGLTTTGISNAGLPTTADFVDPTATVGTKPTVTAAPQVIHGVKQY